MSYILEADSILLEFGTRRILSDIYIKSETGKITALLGRNGTGKTCLLNILYGTRKVRDCSVRLNGEFIKHAYKQLGLIAYLPQFSFVPQSLCIKRIFSDFNLEYTHFQNSFPNISLQQDSEFKSLSGGERRLIEIYLIIKAKSKFVILDEPFSHLSPVLIDSVKELINEEKANKGFIITDHLYSQVLDIADVMYILSDEKTHLISSVEEMENLGYLKMSDPA